MSISRFVPKSISEKDLVITPPESPSIRLRWLAVSIFILSSVLNYMDRQLLSVLAPLLMEEFHFNLTQFGFLVAAISAAYAISSLPAGWLLDRLGVNRGMSVAVSWWSAAAASIAAAFNFPALLLARIALGIGEAASVPAVGKVNGVYLKPDERALGAAVNGVGLSLGLALAPLWISVATRSSWRVPFVVMGIVGFLWIPLWLLTSRYIPPAFESSGPSSPKSQPDLRLLLDANLIRIAATNLLWMGAYSLWSNWTTIYLVKAHGISLQQSARYSWIPPLVSNAGAFFGGWLSQRFVKQGRLPSLSRCRAVQLSALGMLVTFALPLATNAAQATAIISASFFFALAGSVNIYALPIDLFGAERSGIAIAALVFAYGVLQTFLSPIVGFLADRNAYSAVIWIVALPPLLGSYLLTGIRHPEASQ